MSIDGEAPSVRARRDHGAAEPGRFALLGLLLKRPAHGYDLVRYFAPTAALGNVIRLSSSHVYALLTRLERDGLIRGEHQDAGSRPQRRVYRLTGAGEDAVRQWASDPVSHPRDMRIDFPLKLYVARELGVASAERLIDLQRGALLDYIARLESEQNPAGSEGDAAFIDLMRASRAGRAQAALDWLERC